MNFAVIGGDRRQFYLCEALHRCGHSAVLPEFASWQVGSRQKSTSKTKK